MIKEALQYLVELGQPNRVEDGPRLWVDRPLHPVHPNLPTGVATNTLDGLIGLIEQAVEGFLPAGVLIHVESYRRAALVGKQSDDWGRRQVYAAATILDVKGFPFGQWLDHESFVIGLQAWFVTTPDREALLKLASNITGSLVKTSEDDGVSQNVGVKRGVVLKGEALLPNRVKLAPYRTFPEIEQPISEFVFRAHQKDENQIPLLGLFEADGGAWQLEAMKTIGDYLKGKTTIPVIV